MHARVQRHNVFTLTLAGGLAAFAAGCFNPPPPTLHEEMQGLIGILPGLGTFTANYGWPYQAFRDAGATAAIRFFEWDKGRPSPLDHLTGLERNRRHAADIAQELAAYRARQPHAPIHLVGYSAGGGIAVLVAEALPPDVHLTNLVLVQPALSPTYDLGPALRRVDGRLVCFYAPADVLILGLGTSAFGTVDREYTASAGQSGFDAAEAAPDAEQRAKLVQVKWKPRMLWTGHSGSHLGLLTYGFNREFIAPWVLPGGGPVEALDAHVLRPALRPGAPKRR